jgi:hypothetical protein
MMQTSHDLDVGRDDSDEHTTLCSALYSAVLNLPTTASQNEIRERKDTAASKFLDIQKAYEGKNHRT